MSQPQPTKKTVEIAKTTASSPSNIAFVKYWGALDFERVIPCNPSISMTLEVCRSICTVDPNHESDADSIALIDEHGNPAPPPPAFAERTIAHLDILRRWAGSDRRFAITTHNNFPSAAGIASSASGFSALTVATTHALGFRLSADELSVLSKLSGSGSAARSLWGGYVQWPDTSDTQGTGPGVLLAEADHWDLRNVVAILDEDAKKISSRDGHRLATTSPHFARRLELIPDRLKKTRGAIRDRDFAELADVVEEDAVELHLIAMSSRPAVFYWQPGTLAVLSTIRDLRSDGLDACCTIDAGANVHVITTPAAEADVVTALNAVPDVRRTIQDRVGSGPRIEAEHLG